MTADAPILLVEDDAIDVMTVKRALKRAGRTNPLWVAGSGREALDRLGDPGSSPRPGLILLDLNLPLMTGHEFLDQTKHHPGLRTIPIVVLTTSDHRDDVHRSFESGAAGYFVKPVDFSSFERVLETVLHYWTLSISPA